MFCEKVGGGGSQVFNHQEEQVGLKRMVPSILKGDTFLHLSLIIDKMSSRSQECGPIAPIYPFHIKNIMTMLENGKAEPVQNAPSIQGIALTLLVLKLSYFLYS